MYLLFDEAPFIGWTITQKSLIYAVAGGVFLAFLAYWFVQNVIGGLVRKLLAEGTGEENARSLSELGCDNFIFRFMLRNGSTLRNLVSSLTGDLAPLKKDSGEEGKSGFKNKMKKFFKSLLPKRYDFSDAKFFISEENKKKAEERHSGSASPLWLILVFFICALGAFGMTYLLPFIMGFIR